MSKLASGSRPGGPPVVTSSLLQQARQQVFPGEGVVVGDVLRVLVQGLVVREWGACVVHQVLAAPVAPELLEQAPGAVAVPAWDMGQGKAAG